MDKLNKHNFLNELLTYKIYFSLTLYYFCTMKNIILCFIVCSLMIGCSNTNTKLPYLGNPTITATDTVYPSIPDFEFTNQDSLQVSNHTFDNKIYVADFIFLNCPTICPIMTTEMLKVYHEFAATQELLFLSHTIDPKNDSIPRLKSHAENLNIDNEKWHFVTGEKKDIYTIAEKHYYTTAYADSTAPGGFIHSGGLLLIDKNKNIRGVYDGTNSDETVRLISDIKILLNE